MTTPSRHRSLFGRILLLLVLGLLGYSAVGSTPPARSDPFVDPAFNALWDRTDRPVASGQVSRSWIWGPVPGPAKREPYAEGPGGVRLVQYFDKGRMEINNPAADPAAPFYVTSGLLSVELISGQMQTGNAQFETRGSAQIPLASDRDDPTAPTYASFLPVSNVPGGERPAADATGQPAAVTIARDGTISPLPSGRSSYGVTYAYYEPLTHHNVASVFWRFLNSRGQVLGGGKLVDGPLFQPWFAAVGLPISEAYWAQVKIAGARTDVLIQAFERRVLTFVPAHPAEFQVELGNIGLHYLEWRYAVGLPPTIGPPPPPTAAPPAAVAVAGIVTGKNGLDLNSQSVTLINQGAGPAVMSGWRLDSPKNDHDDIYIFPQGFVLPAGAQVVVHAGQGFDSQSDLYMRRITWLFDATGFDGVLLYDAAGREVARYFLQGGAPPTPLPAPTSGVPTPASTAPPGPTVPTKDTPTPPPGSTEVPSATPGGTDLTATPTEALPTPAPTNVGGILTATPTPVRSVTATPNTSVTATRTADPRITPTVTPTAGARGTATSTATPPSGAH